jgi:integrase
MRVQFYLARPWIKNHKGAKVPNPSETGIVADVHVSGGKFRIGINERVLPKYWNNAAHRVKSTSAYRKASVLNARLNDIKSEIEILYHDYKRQHGGEPSAGVFRTLIHGVLGRSKTVRCSFYEYFQDFIDRTTKGQRVTAKGRVISPYKAKTYAVTLGKLNEFRPGLDFEDIDIDFYNSFTGWLRKGKFAENTIGGHIKNLKAVLNEATERGVNTNLAFRSKRFIKPVEDVDNIALTEEELKDIQQLDLSATPYLDRVRDLFLVGCYTGLRYSDFSRLTADNIKGKFIEVTQSKTGNPVSIPVHRVVKSIIKKYSGNLPPGISNQKTNNYLKEVCKKVKSLDRTATKTRIKDGVKSTVSYKKHELVRTHTARRSFATNAYLQGIPTVTIMAITGHKSEKAFLKYIKVSPREHAKIMADHWAKKKSEK